jgi:peptidyl-prolyl cis-trans isomerase C
VRAALLLAAGAAAWCPACSSGPPGAPPPASPAAGARKGLPPIDGVKPLPSPLPLVAARVNSHPIPTINAKIIADESIARGTLSEQQKPLAYRQAVQQLVVRELLFAEAMSRKLTADARKVEQAYDEARIEYKDDKAWAAFLAAKGMDDQSFRAELRAQQTVRELIALEEARVPAAVSEQEALVFYKANPGQFETGEKLRVSHILFRVPEGAPITRKAEQRARAAKIRERIEKGEDFARLARESSDDRDSASKGGEIETFARGRMLPAFERAAFALVPGQISPIVETPLGYHLIKLHQRFDSERIPFERARDRIVQHLARQRRERHLQGLVDSLAAKAKIELYL